MPGAESSFARNTRRAACGEKKNGKHDRHGDHPAVGQEDVRPARQTGGSTRRSFATKCARMAATIRTAHAPCLAPIRNVEAIDAGTYQGLGVLALRELALDTTRCWRRT
jgi:hypothetical protein